jgi:hypothetical protein
MEETVPLRKENTGHTAFNGCFSSHQVSLAFHTRDLSSTCTTATKSISSATPTPRYATDPLLPPTTEQPWQPIRSDKWSTSSFRRRMRRLMKFVSRWVRVGVFRFGFDTWSIVGWFGVNWARMSLLLLDDMAGDICCLFGCAQDVLFCGHVIKVTISSLLLIHKMCSLTSCYSSPFPHTTTI